MFETSARRHCEALFLRWLLAASFCLQPGLSLAQDEGLSSAQRAVVQEMVVLICGTFDTKGSHNEFNFDVNAKVKLDSLLSKFADVGAEAAGNISVEDYSNILQKDLAPRLRDVTDCRLQVWKDLLVRFPQQESRHRESGKGLVTIEKIEATLPSERNIRIKDLLLANDGKRIFLDSVHVYHSTSSTRAIWRDCDMQDLYLFELERHIDFPLPLPGEGSARSYHCNFKVRLNFAEPTDIVFSGGDENPTSAFKVRKYFLVNAIKFDDYMLFNLNEAR